MSDEIVGGFRRMDREKDNNPGVAMYGDKWQYPPRSFSETAYLWSDGIWRTSAEPIPEVYFNRRIAACLRACTGVPTDALERAAECAEHGVIPTLAAQYKADADALLFAAERAYETLIQERNNVPFKSRPYSTEETITILRKSIAKARGIS